MPCMLYHAPLPLSTDLREERRSLIEYCRAGVSLLLSNFKQLTPIPPWQALDTNAVAELKLLKDSDQVQQSEHDIERDTAPKIVE